MLPKSDLSRSEVLNVDWPIGPVDRDRKTVRNGIVQYRYKNGQVFQFPYFEESDVAFNIRRAIFKTVGAMIAESIKTQSNEMFDAATAYAWDTIPKYIDAYSFDWVVQDRRAKIVGPSRGRLLYFVRTGEFVKVGITRNIDIRLLDLYQEFGLHFTIYRTIPFGGHMERKVMRDLSIYQASITKKTGKVSREMFRWCEETKEYIDNFRIE